MEFLIASHSLETIVVALFSSVVGGLVSYILQRKNFYYQIKLKQEEVKTEFMAESTVRHFLSHKSYTDRSFITLKNYLGGFEDDELRKILVRAGAIRTYRDDGSEWWRLLSRMDEYIDSKQKAEGRK